MTRIIVKKISFSSYIKFVALFGASLGLLMTIIFLMMLPVLLSSDASSEGFPVTPFFIGYLFMPVFSSMAFTIWGTMSYPLFLLIRKIFKKITLEIELVPIEEQTQETEMTTNQNSEF